MPPPIGRRQAAQRQQHMQRRTTAKIGPAGASGVASNPGVELAQTGVDVVKYS